MRSNFLSFVIAVPLAFGTGLGIGSVGSVNAATVSNDMSAAIQRITAAVKCATKQPCFSATNSATAGTAIAGTATGSSGTGIAGRNTGSGVGVTASSNTGTALLASSYNLNPLSGAPPIIAIDGSKSAADGLDIANFGPDPHASTLAVATDALGGQISTYLGGGEFAIGAYNAFVIPYSGYPGNGIIGESTEGLGVVGKADNVGPVSSGQAVAAVEANAPNGADLYLGFGSGTFEVTADGDVNASGTITGGVKCRPTTCPAGAKLAAYAPVDALPTMEDFGRAQVVGGAATVRFDGAFASTIDGSKDYHVFLTAEGDNRGLYVSRRTPLGFSVAESMNGHSTLAFSYRIVAHPYGSTAARLPVIPTGRIAAEAKARSQAMTKEMTQDAADRRSRMAAITAGRAAHPARVRHGDEASQLDMK